MILNIALDILSGIVWLIGLFLLCLMGSAILDVQRAYYGPSAGNIHTRVPFEDRLDLERASPARCRFVHFLIFVYVADSIWIYWLCDSSAAVLVLSWAAIVVSCAVIIVLASRKGGTECNCLADLWVV